jgi:integrase/recombinase XerD
MNNDVLIKRFVQELTKEQVSESTIDNYTRMIKQLCAYYPEKEVDNLDIKQLADFMSFLNNRKHYSATTQNLAICAFNIFYNNMLGKKYDLRSIPIKNRIRYSIPIVLEPEEILRLINCIDFPKHRLILLLAYSAGLSVYQIVHIKKDDIDYHTKRIKAIPYKQRGKTIYTVLSDAVSKELKEYLEREKPEKYVFEGRIPGKPYASERMVNYAFDNAIKKAKITTKASPKDLKHSFIVHLRDRGFSVKQVLEMLGHNNSFSFLRYTLANEKNVRDIVSPYDLILTETHSEKINMKILNNLIKKVKDVEEQNYLQEAILCISHGAFRAGIVISWLATIRNIQAQCLQHGNRLNPAIQMHDTNAKNVSTIDDFARIKDRTILEAATTLGIFDKPQKTELIDCLDLRNQCAHPGNYNPGPQKVLSFMEDIIQIVYS